MQFAWLTTLDSATSTKVSMLIDVQQSMLDELIWDLSYSQKSEDVRICDINGNGVIQFSNLNIVSIDEINWQSYTWVLNTDYSIQYPKNSCVQFRNIGSYLSWLMFPYFNVKYTSWYSTIPKEIQYLQYLLVENELNKSWWKEVKSYSLWPRSVTFADETNANTAQTILNNYYIPYV